MVPYDTESLTVPYPKSYNVALDLVLQVGLVRQWPSQQDSVP
jgi:hypothetical protein